MTVVTNIADLREMARKRFALFGLVAA